MISATLVSLALLFQSATPAAVPFCGSRDRDIGRGFTLTQYMFGGASDFTLAYRPPARLVRTQGVASTAPFHFIFSQMSIGDAAPPRLGGPHLGYAGYRFAKRNGTKLGLGVPTLTCGRGVVLANDFSKSPPPESETPISFHSPFFGQNQRSCLALLSQNGRYRFTVAEAPGAVPVIVIDDRMDLKWALAEVERLWRMDLQRGDRGGCRLIPPPPPPGAPPPPPPPTAAPPSSAAPGTAGPVRPSPSRGASGR